jgi:uncharacterized membrane protein YbhN (UPF0104 family)
LSGAYPSATLVFSFSSNGLTAMLADGTRMADERYVRWQGLGIAQMTVAIALISGISVAGLGAGLALIQNDKFVLSPTFKPVFAASLLFLLLAAFLATAMVISRLLDFRLTARQVRAKQWPGYKKPAILFHLDSDAYGRITWGLFWTACVALALGILALIACVAVAYPDRWS